MRDHIPSFPHTSSWCGVKLSTGTTSRLTFYSTVVGKPEEKNQFMRPWRGWNCNIRVCRVYVLTCSRFVFLQCIQGVLGECARLRENVPYVKVHRSNPKHLYPKLNGYGDNGERKVWSSCGFAYCYSYTAHVCPSVSQPSQTHSNFIINRCHSYSEL